MFEGSDLKKPNVRGHQNEFQAKICKKAFTFASKKGGQSFQSPRTNLQEQNFEKKVAKFGSMFGDKCKKIGLCSRTNVKKIAYV